MSNSGRLRALLLERAARWPFPVTAALVPDPDPVLSAADDVVSSDAAILDRCGRWAKLASWLVARRIPTAWVVDLSGSGGVSWPQGPRGW